MLPNDLRLPISTLAVQAGLRAMSKALRSVSFGGTCKLFLMSAWRWPRSGRSTVKNSAVQPASLARSITDSEKPRSRKTYSWNQNGSLIAERTSSIEQIDMVESV